MVVCWNEEGGNVKIELGWVRVRSEVKCESSAR